MPVQTLFDYLAGGDTLDEFLNRFPTVSRASELEAAESAGYEVIVTADQNSPDQQDMAGKKASSRNEDEI